MSIRRALIVSSAAVLLRLLPYAAAHGHGEDMNMSADVEEMPEHTQPNYFRHPEHWNWHLAHTVLMVLAWVVFMPVAIFLSVAKSRFRLPVQLVFHIVNGLGISAGFVYNRSTPDLYVKNAHHSLGWVVVAFAIVWTTMSAVVAFGEHKVARGSCNQGRELNSQSMAHFAHPSLYNDEFSPRDSHDSGFASRQNSTDQIYQKPERLNDVDFDDEKLEDEESERQSFLGSKRVERLMGKGLGKLSKARAMKAIHGVHILMEKTLLLLGFAALTSGFIVSGGLFRGSNITYLCPATSYHKSMRTRLYVCAQ